MLTVKIVALLTAAVLVAGPPTAYKKTRVFVLVPPEQILPGVRKLAVLDFAGQGVDGRSFADVGQFENVTSHLVQPLIARRIASMTRAGPGK